jgi:hypothetical protein
MKNKCNYITLTLLVGAMYASVMTMIATAAAVATTTTDVVVTVIVVIKYLAVGTLRL